MTRRLEDAARREVEGGSNPFSLELSKDVVVNVAPRQTGVYERLAEINELSAYLASEHGLDRNDVRRRVLREDGWIIARGTLLAPIWMDELFEISIARLRRNKDCVWVTELGSLGARPQ